MARQPVQEPVMIDDNDLHGQTFEHPAFGQISVSRVNGSANLYDSDFTHHNTICIAIHHSQLKRNLGRDWHFARDEFVKIELSEAQWATFVSSPNTGGGVPCTIRHIEGRMMAEIPHPKSASEQYGKEQDENVQKALDRLDSVEKMLNESKLSKKAQDEMTSEIRMARMALTSNREFMAEQFGRHMEKVEEKAKTEINAYHTAMVSHLGMQALGHITEGKLYDPIRTIGAITSDKGDEK